MASKIESKIDVGTTTGAAITRKLRKHLATYEPLDPAVPVWVAMQSFVGKKIKNYTDPSAQLATDTRAFIQALAAEDVAGIKKYVRQLNLVERKSEELKNVGIYTCDDIAAFPIVIYWRFGDNVRALSLQEPHNGTDGTERVTNSLFENCNARCLIVNAAHSKSSQLPPRGQPSSTISDASHNIDSLFCIAATEVHNLYPELVNMQIHGMGNPDGGRRMIVSNQYNAHFATAYRSSPAIFAKALAEVFPLEVCNTVFLITDSLPGDKDGVPYEDMFVIHPQSVINTCVETRRVNGGGASSIGKKSLERFVFVETDVYFRSPSAPESHRDDLCRAVNIMMDGWENSPLPIAKLGVPLENNSLLTAFARHADDSYDLPVASVIDEDDKIAEEIEEPDLIKRPRNAIA